MRMAIPHCADIPATYARRSALCMTAVSVAPVVESWNSGFPTAFVTLPVPDVVTVSRKTLIPKTLFRSMTMVRCTVRSCPKASVGT